MTDGPRKRPRVAFGLGFSAAGIVLAYLSLVDRSSPVVGAALSLVPVALVALAMVRRSGHRAWALAAIAAAALAIAARWDLVERHFAGVFLMDHTALNLALAWLFGGTLAGGREPLCTRFARLLHGTLPPEVERYTRQVTIAWTAFFLAVVATSLVLFFTGLHEAWSLLATVGSPVLVALMFAVEYAVRMRVLPHWQRTGVLAGIRAFSRYFAATGAEAPR